MNRRWSWVFGLAIIVTASEAPGREAPLREVQPLRVFAPDLKTQERDELDEQVARFLDEYPEILARPYLPSATQDLLADLDPACVPPSGVEFRPDCLGRLARKYGVGAVMWVSAQRALMGYEIVLVLVDSNGELVRDNRRVRVVSLMDRGFASALEGLWREEIRLPYGMARFVVLSRGKEVSVTLTRRGDPSYPQQRRLTRTTPSVVDVEPGTWEVSGISEPVVVHAGERRSVEVDPILAASAPTADVTPKMVDGPGQIVVELPLPTWRKVGPWALIGGGIAAAAIGVGMYFWASKARDEANRAAWASSPSEGWNGNDTHNDFWIRHQRYDSAKRSWLLRRNTAFVMYGVGVALVSGGVVWFLMDRNDATGGMSFLPSIEDGGIALSVRGGW